MKKGRKRLFVALAASFVLLVTVPLMAAFAGEGDAAVFGSDVSGSDVSGTDVVRSVSLRASLQGSQPDPDKEYSLWLYFYTGVGLGQSYQEITLNIPFHCTDESVSFTAPELTNAINTLKYWKDGQIALTYYPGEQCSIPVSSLEYIPEDDLYMSHNVNAIWEGTQLAISQDAHITLFAPTEQTEDNGDNDGVNYYEYYNEVNGEVRGVYDMESYQFTFEDGYNSILLPADLVPDVEGAVFQEWNTRMDGSGIGYQPGDSVTVSGIGTSLYAIFDTTQKNIIEIDANELLMLNDRDPALGRITRFDSYNDNGVIETFVAPDALVNSVAEFDHWYCSDLDRDFYPGQTYTNVDVTSLLKDKNTDDSYWTVTNCMTLEAVWKGDELYFDRDGMIFFNYEGGGSAYYVFEYTGIYNRTTETYTFDSDHSFRIPEAISPEKEDYTFIGWCENSDGSGTIYKPGDVLTVTSAFGIDVYAVFESDDGVIAIEQLDSTNLAVGVDSYGWIVLEGDLSVEDIKIVVTDVPSNDKEKVQEAVEKVVSLVGKTEGDGFVMLDISLKDTNGDDVKIEEGRLKIYLSYPAGLENASELNYAVYHYENGKATRIPVIKENGKLVFFADSFSPYVLVWSEDVIEEIDADDTDEPTQPAAPSAPQVPVETPKSGDSDSGNDSASVKTTGSAQTTESPSTGDDFSPVIFIVLLVVAAAAAGTVLVLRSRKAKNEEQTDQ